VEEVFSFWLKMAPLARGVGQKWFFGHNFKSTQLFFVLFFALVLRNLYAGLFFAGRNKNSFQKTERINVAKFRSYAPLIFGRHLGH
jgi:hypothetical protein